MNTTTQTAEMHTRNEKAYFGEFGGQFAPETLMPTLQALEVAFEDAKKDPAFQAELAYYLKEYVGRANPLYFARRLSEHYGAKIYLKREDLNHTGAHKINNTLGQALLAKKMGKTRVIAETGAGQHGVATATVCALLGLPCEIYMGEVDAQRQRLNVYRMQLLGAKVNVVKAGQRTLKSAVTAAIQDYVANFQTTHYLLGSAVGPHPFPSMVREFQSVISKEARAQILEKEGRLPDVVMACVNGGSNAIGVFAHFIADASVQLIGVEAGGRGDTIGENCKTIAFGQRGVLQGFLSLLLQDDDGNVSETHSIAAGLDYPGVGPELAYLAKSGRATFASATDAQALAAFDRLAKLEGILPALESSHAVAHLQTMHEQGTLAGKIVIVNLSGRGDKDVEQIAALKLPSETTVDTK